MLFLPGGRAVALGYLMARRPHPGGVSLSKALATSRWRKV